MEAGVVVLCGAEAAEQDRSWTATQHGKETRSLNGQLLSVIISEVVFPFQGQREQSSVAVLKKNIDTAISKRTLHHVLARVKPPPLSCYAALEQGPDGTAVLQRGGLRDSSWFCLTAQAALPANA